MTVLQSPLILRLLLCLATAALATSLEHYATSRPVIAATLAAIFLVAGAVRAVAANRGPDPPVEKALSAKA